MFMKIGHTGMRPNKLFGYDSSHLGYDLIKIKLREIYHKLQPTEIISGMALGFDTLVAELALEMSLPLICAIPCDHQDKLWRQKDREKYHQILQQASEIINVAPGFYEEWKMQRRNIFMVNRSDHMIILWNGSSGGTKNCVEYIKQINKSHQFLEIPEINQ